MRIKNQIIRICIASVLVMLVSCEKDYYYEPHISQATSTLEARYSPTPPSSISSAFWNTADYLIVNSVNVSTNQLYSDGFLNMTGNYLGLPSYSKGTNPGLKLKAAYDSQNLYILAEWTDTKLDLSNGSWLFNGPADSLKSDSSTQWTGQRNSDHLAFAFEIDNASSPAGTFTNVGCAASCHSSVGVGQMFPTSGKVDMWNWSLALTNPLGYAADMVSNSDSMSFDSGNRMYMRNVVSTQRSGPAYEWDGTAQNIVLPNGASSIADPAFYLVNKTAFLGDAIRGDSIYHRTTAPGDCAQCHGDHGQGAINTAINGISQNKKSRATLNASMDGTSDMLAYWGPLNATDRNDVLAFVRGLSGVPGYYLQTPDGSNADVKVVSNVTPIDIKNAMLASTNKHSVYKVLFVRSLKTNNADDKQFDAVEGSTYIFGVALMDNDGKNHIGSLKETLTFK